MSEAVLDVKGLACPLPVLRAKKALREVPVGGLLKVIATDPGSIADMATFCRQTGNELVEQTSGDGVYTHVIRRHA
jgi:tRNA 2-thiouridine synthesizing protein A